MWIAFIEVTIHQFVLASKTVADLAPNMKLFQLLAVAGFALQVSFVNNIYFW